MPADTTDAAIIVRVLAGEKEAYATLVDRHFASCARYARRMLGNVQDAEDAVQEAFVHVYTALPRYRERDRFRAWLFRILVNQCRSHERRRARHKRRFVHDDVATESAAAPPAHDDPHLRDALQCALDTLEPRLREALLLKYGEDLEYEEIARMTGASVSALKMRVKRARDAVRPLLEEMLND